MWAKGFSPRLRVVAADPSQRVDASSNAPAGKSESAGNYEPQADTMAILWDYTIPAENQRISHTLTQSDTSPENTGNGSGGWDRTNDLVINSSLFW
jgi:hypothetical protein